MREYLRLHSQIRDICYRIRYFREQATVSSSTNKRRYYELMIRHELKRLDELLTQVEKMVVKYGRVLGDLGTQVNHNATPCKT